MPRIHSPEALEQGRILALPAAAARHVQVLRMQPGQPLVMFDGRGGEWEATIERMGRADVQVRVERHNPLEREADTRVQLAVAVPANERMDWLVEKAAELGVASLQPLIAERNVLRLQGERALRKQEHWQAIAIAACEQSGRNRVPRVHALEPLSTWLPTADAGARAVLSLAADAEPLHRLAGLPSVLLLSGPEGGLTPAEEQAARASGFVPVTLGPRVLRADTAPLAALAALTLAAGASR